MANAFPWAFILEHNAECSKTTPFGTPVLPDVWITYTALCGLTVVLGEPWVNGKPSSSSLSTTTAWIAILLIRLIWDSCPRMIEDCIFAIMACTRCRGSFVPIGTTAAPALRTANIATIAQSDLSKHVIIIFLCFTPSSIRWWASRSAIALSSEYDRSPFQADTAHASAWSKDWACILSCTHAWTVSYISSFHACSRSISIVSIVSRESVLLPFVSIRDFWSSFNMCWNCSRNDWAWELDTSSSSWSIQFPCLGILLGCQWSKWQSKDSYES